MGEKACLHSDRSFTYQAPDGVSRQDAATLEALHAAIHLEIFGDPKQVFGQSFGHITDGNGPYQSVKCALPNISDQGASALAHIINQSNGKQAYNTGDALKAPDVLDRVNDAELKVYLHLPLSASDKQVDKAFDAWEQNMFEREIGSNERKE